MLSIYLLMDIFKDVSITAWNVRGLANRKGQSYMLELLRKYKPDFVFETHVVFV